MRELYYRWRVEDAAEDGPDDEVLRAQFSLGLQNGPIKQELQRLLRRNSTMAFTDACREAKALEKELSSGEEAMSRQVHTRARSPARVTSADWQEMRETLRAELRQELKDQVALLGRAMVDELQGQLAVPPEGRVPSGIHHRPPIAGIQPPSGQQPEQSRQPQRPRRGNFNPFQWDSSGRPICRDCGEVGHIQRFCPRRRTAPTGF